MKAWITLALLASTAVTVPLRGEAQEQFNVQELLDHCEAEDQPAVMLCLGVIIGVSSVMSANCGIAQGEGGLRTLAANVGGVSTGAMLQVFKNWARDNPQSWGIPGSFGAMLAINSAFPC